MLYWKLRGNGRRNTIKNLSMIIDVLHGEVRLSRKIVKCVTVNKENISIKLRMKRELTREWWMKDWLERREEWKRRA